MENKLNEINVSLAEIKSDLKYHIKRTDDLQDMTTTMWKVYVGVKWIVGALISVGTVVALYIRIF